MLIVHAASEVVGYAKTGGLADVAGSLPRALARRGHSCAVIMPLYRGARAGKIPVTSTDHRLSIPVGKSKIEGRIWRSQMPDSNVPVYLIEQADFFERDDPGSGRGLYQFTLPNGNKADYPDNLQRFIFFDRAVLEALRLLDLWPDVLHNHDWQAGLIPVYLRETYCHHADYKLREKYQKINTIFTIHNIAYQGLFKAVDLPVTGLDWRLFNYQQLEFYGQLNFLKAGIVFSDRVTTVSARYAEEIQTPYYAYGLQGVLSERRQRLSGIVNGVDYEVWDPAVDRHLPANYTVDDLAGKAKCKAALQRRYGLPEEPDAPLLAMVARLVEQKGLDLLAKSGEAIMSLPGAPPVQLIVLGEGDPPYHRMLEDLKQRFPNQVGLTLGFDETLAHQIEAGADIFLMPSMFEPSGLNQLYSLKYGTVPVVRACGGLADTITDSTLHSQTERTANGFTFVPFAASVFLWAVQRAVEAYRDHPQLWRQLQRTGMSQDWSWNRSAAEYEKLYKQIVE